MENIQNIFNSVNTTSREFCNISANEKEEDHLYKQFPAMSLDIFNTLDDEVKLLKSAKIDVYVYNAFLSTCALPEIIWLKLKLCFYCTSVYLT